MAHTPKLVKRLKPISPRTTINFITIIQISNRNDLNENFYKFKNLQRDFKAFLKKSA